MMRSLWSGVAGLKTHQLEMDVIGNNIANVNTTAYKSQATGFADVLYQTVKSGTGAGNNLGTTNASQIGLGSKVSSIYTNISKAGSMQTTDNALDLMITGDSFFIIEAQGVNNFTRDGSFTIDAEGYLVTQNNGYYVKGVDNGQVTNGAPDRLQVIKRAQIDLNENGTIDSNENVDYIPGEATSASYLRGNIDRDDDQLKDGRTLAIEVYGKDGKTYTIKYKLTDAEDNDNSTYRFSVDKVLDENGKTLNNSVQEDILLKYDEHNGKLTGITPYNRIVSSGPVATTSEDGTVTETKISFSEKIRSSSWTSSITGTDGKKYTYYYSIEPSKSADADYDLVLEKITDASGKTYPSQTNGDIARVALKFDPDTGALVTVGGEARTDYTYELNIPDTENLDWKIGPLTFDFSNLTKSVVNGFKYTFGFDGEASEIGNLEVDFENTTNFANSVSGKHSSSILAYKGDVQGQRKGYPLGVLNGVSFGTDGTIYGSYSNGQTKLKGQIAVALFNNAMGLEKVGDNLYAESLNSGAAIIQDITKDGGYMSSGVLESSNVDLAKEFTDMITTQRGFQANSRVITTSDEMLQILKSLKR